MNVELDKNRHKAIMVSFTGVDEVMEVVKRHREPKFDKVAQYHCECFTHKTGWNGYHTVDMVAKELLNPTPNMADVLSSSNALFDSEDWATEKPRRKIKRRLEDGDEIDVERWLDREPDMWEESRKVKGPRFGVRIGVNIATSAHVGESGFKWRTSAVVAIFRICEELMIPCEIACYEQNTNYVTIDGQRLGLFFEFPAKRPEHPLDVDLLGYVLGSQSFFRCAVLGAEIIGTKAAFGDRADIHAGLGCPHEVTRKQENEFVLSRACLDEATANAEVTRFKKWLAAIREQSKYNMDGLEDRRD